MNKYLKAGLFLFIETIAVFMVFFAFMVTAFSEGRLQDLYFYLIIFSILGILLLALIPLSFYSKKRRFIKIGWCVWATLLIVPIGTYEGIKTYHRSLILTEDSRVDLTTYQPFLEANKTAKLDDVSTLKLTDSLPGLDGATAFYPLYAAFVQAVYPHGLYDIDTSIIQCNRTSSAYYGLAYKETDIIFAFEPAPRHDMYDDFEYVVSYAPDASMLYMSKDSVPRESFIRMFPEDSIMNDTVEYEYFLDISLTAIGREAFVFFVNAQNPVDNLTVEQLRRIYTGEITNWKEVGGKNEKIIAFQRNNGSGSQTAFLKFMEENQPMSPPHDKIIDLMEGIISQTADYANYRNAIGYSFRYFAEEMVGNEQIKLLKINDVYPSKETTCNSTYPLIYDFYAVTRTGNASSNVQKFINWILSPQGQELVYRVGYCPVKKY